MAKRATLLGMGSVTAVINGSAVGIGELGTMALESASDYLSKAGNLSGLANIEAARTALGLGTLAVENTPLAVGKGGTGLTAGNSGGVLAFTASGTIASSAALTASALVLGGGVGAVPSTPLGLGTSTQVLCGNATGAPTWGAVDLTAAVTGILPGANGGTANGFMAFSGPAASLKTFTLPNSGATILTTNAAVTTGQGGTGQDWSASSGIPLLTSGSASLLSSTGSGSVVRATSPTLVTPALGVATATSINGNTITTGSGTLTVGAGKTLTANNSVAFTGTDGSTLTFGGGGTVAYAANKLSAFAATTSAELAGVISDETGSGALVFATSPTLTTPSVGDASATSVTAGTSHLRSGALTSSVSTSATTIYTASSSSVDAAFVMVTGDNGSAFFADFVSFVPGGSGAVVLGAGALFGSPAARTYSVTGTALKVAMASGTYSVRTAPFEIQ